MTSELLVDAIKGVTSAGSVVVTGEGNSTTTNLQQGLAKHWVKFAPDAAADDSLNNSSITDNGQGRFTVARTNNMGNANYVTQVNGDWTVGTDTGLGIYTADNGVITTSDTKLVFYTSGGAAFYDVDGMGATINGDLA
jgi:hypothetical protein